MQIPPPILYIAILFGLLLTLFFVRPSFAREYITPGGARVDVPETKNIIWKNFILPSGISFVAVQIIPLADAANITLKEMIDLYIDRIAANNNFSADILKKIILCESNYDPKALNPKDTDLRPKFGLLQYDRLTWENAGGGDIWSWQEQLNNVPNLIKSKKGWNHWPYCFKVKVLGKEWK